MLLKYFLDTISGRRQGFFASCLRGTLWLFSCLFFLSYCVRSFLYRLGIKKTKRLPARVISVGNLVAGGTGKTPLAIFLAKQLVSDFPTAVILRGYKAKASSPVILSQEEKNDPALVGDEACIVSRHIPQAMVCVAKKKILAAECAVEAGAKVLIIDDGFQHLALHCDTNVVLIDSDNPFGYGYLLPRGLLREPLWALKRADLVVINCRHALCDTALIEKKIRLYTEVPIVKALMKYDGLFDCEDKPQELLPQTKAGLFCGIAKPEQFVHFVESLGFDVVHTHFTGDHERLSKDELQQFASEAKERGAAFLLCTEKDRVKIEKEGAYCLPIYWIKIQMEMREGQELNRFLEL